MLLVLKDADGDTYLVFLENVEEDSVDWSTFKLWN